MSPLWLILIVPAAMICGMGFFAWMFDTPTQRAAKAEYRARMLERQYKQLCEIAQPAPHGAIIIADIRARHEAERKALDE